MKKIQEEIIVLFHAALLGRTDVVQNAISSIRSSGNLSDAEVAAAISTGRSEDSATPLHIAAHFGHKDVIRSLLNGGADMTSIPTVGEYADQRPYELASDSTKETFHVYMFEQIAMDNENAIVRLIHGGVPVDSVDDSTVADSTLHWAASFGSTKVATVLLTYGCNVDIRNALNQTPLHLACKGKHYDLIKMFLDEGALIDVVDTNGKKPADLLVAGSNPAIAELLQHPAQPSMRLHIAAEKMKEELAAKEQLLHQQRLLQRQRSNSSVSVGNALDGIDLDDLSEDGIYFDDDNNDETEANSDEKELLLIFWPPVKRQKHKKGSRPLVLKNNRNLLISVASAEIDIVPLLTWSGLMDVMDQMGFQVQAKRSSTGAKMRLCIDRNICPVPNSYELKVTSEQIFITAGDSTGLLYGVYTLIQLLKLHSDAKVDPAGVFSLTVPAIEITDRPDVSQRAVLWSYRQQVRTSTTRMQEQIQLLSRLRMNTLFLVIDPVDSRSVAQLQQAAKHGAVAPSAQLLPSQSNTDVTSTRVYALDEMSRRHCVDLIPTLIIQSIHQRLPLDVLKNFSHKMISIVFVFDKHSIAAELTAVAVATAASSAGGASDHTQAQTPVDLAAVTAACVTACELVIKDAHLAGCTTISLASSEWARTTADPMSLAVNAGLSATERDFGVMYPSSLFSKPVLCVQDYVQAISSYADKVQDVCSPLSVFPAFMDRDFMYPALLLKFYSFMFAGFAWNKSSLLDMIGDPSGMAFNPNIVREVMYLLLFPPKVELSSAAFHVMMDLMTGVTCAGELSTAADALAESVHSTPGAPSAVHKPLLERTSSEISLPGAPDSQSPRGGNAGRNDVTGTAVLRHDLARAEKLLWALLTAHDDTSASAVPFKNEAAVCLKLYRRVLNAAQWKPDGLTNKQAASGGLLSFVGIGSAANFSGNLDDSSGDHGTANGIDTTPSVVLEVEELFCIINMLSALCKALVLAHKTYEKKHTEAEGYAVSCEVLFGALSVGTKSDVANSILECLSGCTYLWRRRFDGQLMASFKATNILLHSAGKVGAKEHRTHNGKTLSAQTLKEANRRFLLQESPSVPASAIFKVLTKHIPLPKSVHEFIQRLFSR